MNNIINQKTFNILSSGTTFVAGESLSNEEISIIKSELKIIYNEEIASSFSDTFSLAFIIIDSSEKYLGDSYEEIMRNLYKLKKDLRIKKIKKLCIL